MARLSPEALKHSAAPTATDLSVNVLNQEMLIRTKLEALGFQSDKEMHIVVGGRSGWVRLNFEKKEVQLSNQALVLPLFIAERHPHTVPDSGDGMRERITALSYLYQRIGSLGWAHTVAPDRACPEAMPNRHKP